MNNHQFKPFDKVLVRDSENGPWRTNIYSHNTNFAYTCLHGTWNYCIPYNKNTEHLIGKTDPYIPPKPKEWKVSCVRYNFDEKYTTEEFIEFIKNNDLSVFTVKRIKPDNQPD